MGGGRAAEETLGDALERLGLRPLPSVEKLQAMTEYEPSSAHAASLVSEEQDEQLPAWCREMLQRRAAETIARRDAEQAAARRVS